MKLQRTIIILFLILTIYCKPEVSFPYHRYIILIKPTQQIKNNELSSTEPETVVTPVFFPSSGHYSSPQTITLSTETVGATIYYTTDGTEPTTSSSLYNSSLGHIWFIAGKSLKAIAVKSGAISSSIASAEYSYSLLKTGQTSCWDNAGVPISCVGTNHDGETQFGLTRSYTDNGDGTIGDNATGLIWQKCSKGQNNDTVCSGTSTGSDWNGAISFCEGLSLSGRTWRLPNSIELETLPNYGIGDGSTIPVIDTAYFPNTPLTFYWSSSNYEPNSTQAWYAFFNNARVGGERVKTNFDRVRCVSGTTKSQVKTYIDNNDGTIKDKATGLVWQKCTRGFTNVTDCTGGSATTINWIGAISYCSSLTLAGRSWRLPSGLELNSLVDKSVTSIPVINSTVFPNTVLTSYWSSTSVNIGPSGAWVVNYSGGLAFNFNSKGINLNVRCVSGP